MSNTKSPASKSPMNQPAASRIASSTARTGNGQVPADSFAARAERAAAKNAKP
ncbi:hypothetical protein [Pseudomonas sp. Fl5BN2]|uniref:hypothetical protein n=1 Tax=Pseudomonas sp. Fl5BN2 TaxID=2697652 RepID=UPI0015B65E56|nr:hypothetical protein [Pseudomonas sp. Fl5BN2]